MCLLVAVCSGFKRPIHVDSDVFGLKILLGRGKQEKQREREERERERER